MEFPEIVHLNVGGRHMSTYLTTLTKYPQSMLAAMFSGRHPVTRDEDGRYFVDVGGDIFEYVLDFLRLKKIPPKDKWEDVKKYAGYFALDELAEACTVNMVKQDIPNQEDFLKKLKSSFPNYETYRNELVSKLRESDVNTSSIYIKLRQTAPCDAGFNCQVELEECYMLNFDVYDWEPEFNTFELTDITVNEYARRELLFTLLKQDLQKMGFTPCPEVKDTEQCCSVAKLFKLNLP